MRKLNLLMTGLATTLLLCSCSKGGGDNNNNNNNNPPASDTFYLTLSKPSMKADAFDELKFIVKDKNNVDVTATATIKVDGNVVASKIYTTGTVGGHQAVATVGGKSTATKSFNAVAPGTSPFTRKVLVEDFTGTWCQYCTRMAAKLKDFKNNNPNLIWTAVHGPSNSSDPFKYQFHDQMATKYGVSGWPSAIMSRRVKWDENPSTINAELAIRAPLGIAFETSISGTTVNVKTKVKFDVSTSAPLKLVVMLVEDGLVYQQQNAYTQYGTTPVIANFIHDMTLRKASTDIFGDAIPVASQTEGNIYEHTSTFSTTGFNASKLKVVATVLTESNTLTYKGCLNTQEVVAGQNKNFD